MRRASLAGILLTTCASCATVTPSSDVAVQRTSQSHFRVVGRQPETRRAEAARMVAATVPAAHETALAAVFHEKSEAVETAALFQPADTPPPPANEPLAAPPSSSDPDATPEPSPAEEQSGMTLQDAIGRALGANPTIAESAASIRRLQSEWNQTGYYPNPTAGYVASEIGNDGQEGQQGIYFGQVIVTADKLDWNRAVASGGVAFAQAQAEAQRLRVVTDTEIRFYEALGAQRLVEISQRIQDNAQQGFDATKALVKAGQSAGADELQAKAVLERANVGVRQAEARAEAAWRRLAAMLGQPDLPRTDLVGDLEQDQQIGDFEAVWRMLCASSPELQAASARVARQKAKIGREEAQSVPDVDAQNMVQYDTSTNTTVVGLQYTIPVPVFHQNQGAISASRAAYVRACRDYRRVELNLRDRLAQAFRDVNVARAQVVTYREKVIPAVTESLELVRSAYPAQFGILRLITSQQDYADATAEYVRALIDLRTAEARIDGLLLTGGLDEPVAPEPLGGAADLAGVPRAE